MRMLLSLRSALIIAAVCITSSLSYAVEVQPVVSPGGIKAWLVRDASVPLISMSFEFKGGTALDPDGKEGLATMVSALLDEGAGDMDSQTFQGKLEDLSVSIGFSASRTSFSGRLQTLSRHQDEAFRLLTAALSSPRFDDRPVERIRTRIISSLKAQEKNPDTIAGRVFAKHIYGAHPFAKPSQGFEDTVKTITRADLVSFTGQRFARDNLIVGVVGDVTPEKLAGILDSVFGGLPETAAPWDIPELDPAFDGGVLVEKLDIPQSRILFAQPGIARDDPDYYAAYVANHILGGGGFSSRLYSEVREQRGLAYSASSYLSTGEVVNILAGSAGTQNSRVAETVGVIRDVWRKMQQDGPTNDEITAAVQYLTGSWPLNFDRSASIAGMLVTVQSLDLGIDYLDRRNDYLTALQPDQIRSVIKKLLNPDRLTFVIVGEPDPRVPGQ
ncbi:MAG: pitrilysin family protein [Rhodospirillales bacterium]